MTLVMTMPSAYSLGLNAANTFCAAVVADTVVVLVDIFAAVRAVIAPACAVIAKSVIIAVAEGTVLRAAIQNRTLCTSVTVSAVSAVSGNDYAEH